MSKPILIGMNNPLSLRAGHELFPHPPGCTGHRIWSMLHGRTGAYRHEYLETFDRRNLVRGETYDKRAALEHAVRIVRELRGRGRTAVLLGALVREAFDRALWLEHQEALPPLLVHPQEAGGSTWRQIPHPSGRNLFYNDKKNQEVVAMLLEELYVDYHKREKATC